MIVRRTATWLAVAALALATVACAEKPQTLGTQVKAGDTAPWAGTSSTTAAPGLKAGDKAAWVDELRTRAQGQNDYARGGN